MAKRRTRVPFYGKAEQRHRQAARNYAQAGQHDLANFHHMQEVVGLAKKWEVRGGRPDIAARILKNGLGKVQAS